MFMSYVVDAEILPPLCWLVLEPVLNLHNLLAPGPPRAPGGSAGYRVAAVGCAHSPLADKSFVIILVGESRSSAMKNHTTMTRSNSNTVVVHH